MRCVRYVLVNGKMHTEFCEEKEMKKDNSEGVGVSGRTKVK
jgi:hypothetical protein